MTVKNFRSKVKKNTPQVALHSIMTLVVGGWKSGKTRLWKEVTELHYANPDEAMLLSFEDGYETWELDNIIPLHEEGADEDLWKVWDYFKNVAVPGLVEEAKEGRIVKLLGVDTADKAIDSCVAWILHTYKAKYGKTFESIQDITESTNGKENGWTVLYNELNKPFDTLKNAGYGLFILGWTKERETTLYNGMKYNSIQLMMSGTARKVFESQASLICCLHNEVIVTDRTGKVLDENLKDKKQKEKASNFHETKTVMYFRPSEYIDVAGGRYVNLPDKVDYSAENFLKVFEDAVNGQLKKTSKDVTDLKVEQEEARDEKAKEFAGRLDHAENETVEGIMNHLNKKIPGASVELRKALAAKLGELQKQGKISAVNYTTIKDLEQLKIVKQVTDELIA